MREENTPFDKAQLRLIRKFKSIFKLENCEVENEAWLVLADLRAQGRNPVTDFNSVLWSRLKNIYRCSGFWAHPTFAGSVRDVLHPEKGFDREALILSLSDDSKALKNIELFSGCASTKELAEKNNWSLATAKRYVAAAIAEAESGYSHDLFEPNHDEDWRPARKFKKCTLTDLARDLDFDEGEEDIGEAYFENREVA